MTLATSSSANTTPNSASSSMTQRTVPRAVPLLDPSRCPSTEQALESICHFVAAHDNRTIGVVGRRWEVRVCLEELLRRAKVSFVKETHDRCVHYLIQAGSGEPLPVEHIPEIVQQHKETQACEEEHQLQQALELSRRDQQEQQQQQHERLSTPITSQELNNHALSTEAAALEYALKLSQQETEQANNHQHFERTETTNSTNTNKNNLSSPTTLREEAAIDYAIQLSQKQQQQQQQHEPTSTTKSTTRVSFSKTVSSEKEQRQSQEAQDAELARRVAKDGSLVFQQGNEPGKPLLEVYEDPLENRAISTNDEITTNIKSNNHNSNRQDSASSAVSQDEALALRVAVEGSLVLHEQDIRKSLVDDNDDGHHNPANNDHNTANEHSNSTLPSRHTEQQQSLQSLQDSTSSAVSDDEALALRVAVEGSLVLHEQEAGKPLIEDDEQQQQQQHDITDEALALRVAREGSWVLSAAANSHHAQPGALLVPEELAQMSSICKDESDNAPPSFQIILCLQCRTEIQAPLVFQKISCPGCQYVNRSD